MSEQNSTAEEFIADVSSPDGDKSSECRRIDPIGAGILAEPSDADRAKALLLPGREDLVLLWNRYRARTSRQLSLDRIDLSRVNLSGADLTNCSMRAANLREAKLLGAYLDDSDLTGANLVQSRLEAAYLRRTRLMRADLSGAVLRWADLDEADLRNASLLDAALDPCDWGGSDLTGAQLSSSTSAQIAAEISKLETMADHPRKVFFALVGLCIFSILTAVGASEVDLISGRGSIRIPLLDSLVPLRGFFYVAPTACCVVMLYVFAHLKQLRVAAQKLPAWFPDGAVLAERLSPWTQIVVPSDAQPKLVRLLESEQPPRRMALGRRLLSLAVGWLVPWCSLVPYAVYFRSRRADEVALLGLGVLLIGICNGVAWCMVQADNNQSRGNFRARIAISVGITILMFGLATALGAVLSGPLRARNSDLVALVLERVNLSRADFSYATLTKTQFRHSNLAYGTIWGANLEYAAADTSVFRGLRATRSNLNGGFFKQSDFRESVFQHAVARNAQFYQVLLTGIDFEGADLRSTKIECATAQNASFNGADLRDAQLDCVDLRNSSLMSVMTSGITVARIVCNENTALENNADAAAIRSGCIPYEQVEVDCRKCLESLNRAARIPGPGHT